MAIGLGSKYFRRIKQIWKPVAGDRYVIPFCTPVILRPRTLVIGTNHSDFVKGGGLEAERIAATLAARVPKQSTFLCDNHQFSRGLHAVCNRVGIVVDERWVGTNRCAIQTGPEGIKELRSQPQLFRECQGLMDMLLRELIVEIKPRNVLLLGSYACRLYFPAGTKLMDSELQPLQFKVGRSNVLAIPLPHPSYASTWRISSERLAKFFVK